MRSLHSFTELIIFYFALYLYYIFLPYHNAYDVLETYSLIIGKGECKQERGQAPLYNLFLLSFTRRGGIKGVRFINILQPL